MNILKSIWDLVVKLSVVLVVVGGIDHWTEEIFGVGSELGFLGAFYAGYVIYYFVSKKEK